MASRSRKRSSHQHKTYHPLFSPAATFFFWSAGILVIGLGIYMTLHHEAAIGYRRMRYSGSPYGISTISGPAAIVMGFAFLLFPLYDIVQSFRHRS